MVVARIPTLRIQLSVGVLHAARQVWRRAPHQIDDGG